MIIDRKCIRRTPAAERTAGALYVDEIKVHKVPELKDGQWIEVPRYGWKDLGSSHVAP